MAICGTQTPEKARHGNELVLLSARRSAIRELSSVTMVIVALVCLTTLSGCIPAMKFGYPPRVENLNSLQPGISTTRDILLSLGEPRGSGKVRLTPDVESRSIWYYEYVESSGKSAKMKFLLVFVDKNFYDGHLWFSSSYTHKVD